MRHWLLGWFLWGALWLPTAWATEQIFVYGTTGSLSTTATQYSPLRGDLSFDANAGNRCIFIPTAGTTKDLRITLSAAPGAGTSRTFAVYNVTTAAALLTSCTISDTATSCNTATTDTYAAGDCLAIRSTLAGAVAAAVPAMTVDLDSTTDAESAYGGNSTTTNISTTATSYHALSGHAAMQTGEDRVSFLASTAGDLTAMKCDLDADPGAGASHVFTSRVNEASDTDLTCTIADVAGACTDTAAAGLVAVVAGDRFSITSVPTNAPTGGGRARCSVTFTAGTNGRFMFAYTDNDALHATATEYNAVMEAILVWTATEGDRDQLAQSMDILNMYARLPVGSPGAGKSYALTLRVGAADSSPLLSVTIADTATTGNATATVTIANDNLLDTKSVPTSTPTARAAQVGYTGFISQPSARRVMVISKEATWHESFWQLF